MEQIVQQIEQYKQEMQAFEATTPDQVEAFRIKYLGTKGLVKTVMGEMKNVPNEQKKVFGQILNEFKEFAEARYTALKEQTEGVAAGGGQQRDITLPGEVFPVGTRHPLNIVRNQIVSIFGRLVSRELRKLTA